MLEFVSEIAARSAVLVLDPGMLPAVVLSLCFASWLNVAAAAFPKGDQQNSWETGLGDLIVAFPSTKLNSSEEHMALVRASRAWRKVGSTPFQVHLFYLSADCLNMRRRHELVNVHNSKLPVSGRVSELL